MIRKKSEDAINAQLHSPYRSLLGTVAFLFLTRADVAVYGSALQRWGSRAKGDPCQETECAYHMDTSEPKVSRVQNVRCTGKPAG